MPPGYSLLQAMVKSGAFLKNPISSVVKAMKLFSGTYSAALGANRKLITTQDAGFINYVLKENHKNYQKSALSTESAGRFMGKGLLFSNGGFWLRQRRIIQPAFHKEKLHGLYAIMIKSISGCLAQFPEGNSVDLYPHIHRLSFNVLLQSIFNIPVPADIMTEIGQLFSDIQEFLIRDTNQPLGRIFYPITGAEKASHKKSKRLREIISSIIVERKTGNKENGDLLDMLLNCTYEDTGEKMTEEQVIDEVLILVFAGHETTANTLSWLLYLLASNPEVVEHLRASIAGKEICESLANEYLKATIHEGMRLYPAVWMTERAAIEDDQFGGFSFPAKTIIVPFFFGLHRDENIWEDPLAFKPQRFIAGPKTARPGHFFPFGAGPRMCVGNNFAMAEMSFFLHSFLNGFRIEATGQVPEMKALITLRPDKVILHVQRRPSAI